MLESTPNPEPSGHSTATNHVTALSQGKCSQEDTKTHIKHLGHQTDANPRPFSLNYKPHLNELTGNKIRLSPAVHLVGHLCTLSLSFSSLKAAILETNRHFHKEITHWKSSFSGWELPLRQSYEGNKGRGCDVHYHISEEGFKLQLKPLGRWQIDCDPRSELSCWLNGPLENIHDLVQQRWES